MRTVFLAATLVCSLGTAGCIVLPFVTPPVRGAIGGRAYFPRLKDGDRGMLNGQVSLNPLQLTSKLLERRFDFGVGYVGNTGDKYYFNGAYLELTAFPWINKLGKGAIARASISAEPTFFVDKYERIGAGGGGKLGIEVAGFAKGAFEDSGQKGFAGGWAYGEGGIGCYLEGFGARVFDDFTAGRGTTYFSIGGGLSVRLPASLGIFVVTK